MKLVLSPKAVEDLEEIGDYIARESLPLRDFPTPMRTRIKQCPVARLCAR